VVKCKNVRGNGGPHDDSGAHTIYTQIAFQDEAVLTFHNVFKGINTQF